MTKGQKRFVRRKLRAAGRGEAGWKQVICRAMDYYARQDPVCAGVLRLRYLEGLPEDRVYPQLHIGRTTYYRKELEAISTVAVYAAAAGLMDEE